MDGIVEFLQTEKAIALIISVFIFLITIILVTNRWINFSVTLLLLFFTIASGLVIGNYSTLKNYFQNYNQNTLALNEESETVFRNQLLQAVEDVKLEVSVEKANIQHLVSQVDEIFDQMEIQKQKLKSFIDETRDHFKIGQDEKPNLKDAEELKQPL